MALFRAVTIAAKINKKTFKVGNPSAAKRTEAKAKGKANKVCENRTNPK
jgi:hypothetical protein